MSSTMNIFQGNDHNNHVSILEAATQPQRRAFKDVTNAGPFANANAKNSKIVSKSSSRAGILTNKSNNKQVVAKASNSKPRNPYANKIHTTRSNNNNGFPVKINNSKPREEPPHDIDELVCDNPFFATDYVEDMYTHFREKEATVEAYMEHQPEIQSRHRSVLVDWLIDVHTRINSNDSSRLSCDTLFLTVNLIDRYLERQCCRKWELQMLGAACFMIASKYEDIYPPSMYDIVHASDNIFTVDDLVRMEEAVLTTLEYGVTVPTSYTFFNRFIRAAHADDESNALARFLLTGTLQHYSLVSKFSPSLLAAAVVWLTRHNQPRYNRSWSPTLTHYCGYSEQDVIPAARAILQAKEDGEATYNAVPDKFNCLAFNFVAQKNLRCDI